MRAALALAVLLLSSCSTLLSDDARQRIEGDSPWPRALVRAAVEDFVRESLIAFPDEGADSARCVAIEFVPHLEYPGIGNLSGITDGPCKVRVSTEYTNQLHKTALWHELTHAVLWSRYSEPDATHEKGSGPWTDAHNDVIAGLKATWQARSASLD